MKGSELGAIEAAYRDGYARFVHVARAVAGDEQAARDAVHDGFIRAVRHRRRYRGSGSLEAWLWRIVVNEARRRASRRDVPVDPARLPEAAAASNGYPEQAHVRAALAALPERQRLALFLRYFADLDYRAIAEVLGIAEGTVAATLSAGHAALRRRLTEVEP